jgi:hypothetical protein
MYDGRSAVGITVQPLAAFLSEATVFDPVLKQLADRHEPAIVGCIRRILGLPLGGSIDVVQPNLPAVTIDADRVYRITTPIPMLLHTEWESSSALGRPDRFLVYNTLLTRQTDLPVQTVVLLLRKEEKSTDLTGVLTRTLPGTGDYLVWRYSVIRLWELPSDLFLTDPGLTPLAPLSAVDESGLAKLADQIQDQWKELPEADLKELKTATETLMGLRYSKDLVHRLFGEVSAMEESVIYQEILHIGQAKALRTARQTLLDIGKKRLGTPDARQRQTIEQCDDLERLSRMTVASVDAPDWSTVLAIE